MVISGLNQSQRRPVYMLRRTEFIGRPTRLGTRIGSRPGSNTSETTPGVHSQGRVVEFSPDVGFNTKNYMYRELNPSMGNDNNE